MPFVVISCAFKIHSTERADEVSRAAHLYPCAQHETRSATVQFPNTTTVYSQRLQRCLRLWAPRYLELTDDYNTYHDLPFLIKQLKEQHGIVDEKNSSLGKDVDTFSGVQNFSYDVIDPERLC